MECSTFWYLFICSDDSIRQWQHRWPNNSINNNAHTKKINITYTKYASTSPNVADFVCTMIFLFVFMLISYVCESYDSNWIFTLLYSELYKRIALIVPCAKISWQIIWKFPRKLRRSRNLSISIDASSNGLKAKKCLVFVLWQRATWYYQTHIKPIMGAVKVNHLEPKFVHTGIWSKFMNFFFVRVLLSPTLIFSVINHHFRSVIINSSNASCYVQKVQHVEK